MTTYHLHKVNLSEGQRRKLLTAYGNKSEITIRLSNSDLTGNSSLMLTHRQINKLNKAKKSGVGSDLKISKTQIRKVIKVGHGAPRIGFPMIGISAPKTRTRSRRSTTMTKSNTTTDNTTKKDGGKIKLPSKKEILSYRSPPIIGSWDEYNKFLKTGGLVLPKKKDFKAEKKVRKPTFYKNIPMSNFDLINWCSYLNIPIKDVLMRDETVPHNHKQALFIYNLEPSYMSGSHWVATYVKDKVINYFDSFGMPPFQGIVDHAKKKNLTLLHQINQIQNINTTTCGYFCLYYLNEMNKGNSYYSLLEVFDIYDTMKTERFIEHYIRNI